MEKNNRKFDAETAGGILIMIAGGLLIGFIIANS